MHARKNKNTCRHLPMPVFISPVVCCEGKVLVEWRMPSLKTPLAIKSRRRQHRDCPAVEISPKAHCTRDCAKFRMKLHHWHVWCSGKGQNFRCDKGLGIWIFYECRENQRLRSGDGCERLEGNEVGRNGFWDMVDSRVVVGGRGRLAV